MVLPHNGKQNAAGKHYAISDIIWSSTITSIWRIKVRMICFTPY